MSGRRPSPVWGATLLLVLVTLFSLAVRGAERGRLAARASPRFRIDPAMLLPSVAPPWMLEEDLASIRAAAGLEDADLNLFAPDLVERLTEAFGRSPWVRRVVTARPGWPDRISIALELRKPFAGIPDGEERIVLVCEEGVRLPGVRRYRPDGLDAPLWRLEGVERPLPPPGGVLGPAGLEALAVAADLGRLDPGVVAGAGLTTIDVSGFRRGEPTVLRTPGGVLVEWGRSTAHEFGPLDPSPADKERKIRRLLALHPGLAGLARVKLQYDEVVIVAAPEAPAALR